MSTIATPGKTGCIILSGGISSRMNTHKAGLRFSESENFLEHIIAAYKLMNLAKIVVVKNPGVKFETVKDDRVTTIDNKEPQLGRLYSLQLGLSAMTGIEYCFIQNIDNPFVSIDLLSAIYGARTGADYISPVHNGKGGHPILISAPVMNRILQCRDYSLTLRDILADFNRYMVNTDDDGCLININTPSDYQSYFPGATKIGVQ